MCFLGDVKGTVGVFGVVVECLGDAAGANVTGAGVAGVADAGVTGGSGVSAAATTATAAGAFFEEGIKMCFFALVWGTPSSYGLPPSSLPGYF